MLLPLPNMSQTSTEQVYGTLSFTLTTTSDNFLPGTQNKRTFRRKIAWPASSLQDAE